MKCKVCDSAKFSIVFRKISYSKRYTLIRCKSCGFMTIKEYPDQKTLDAFFAQDYDFSYMKIKNARVARIVRNRLRWLRKFKARGSLLEIGCGSGIFLSEANRYFDVEGFDKSPQAAKMGKKFGIKIRAKDLFEYKQKESYDVIALFHVLEHLIEPGEALDKICEMVKDDGVVYIIVPNIKSLSFRLFGKHWEWINPPKHLSYFDSETITKMLSKHGFDVVDIKTQRGDDYNFLFNIIFYILSVTRIRSKMASGAKGEGLLRFYELVFDVTNLLVLPFYPIRKLLEWSGLGSEMAVIARRR